MAAEQVRSFRLIYFATHYDHHSILKSITELVAAIAAIPTCAIDFMQIAEKTISRLLTRATSKSAEVRFRG